MKHSESIKELAQALAKAQSQIEGAKKDASNPFFKSKYADLSSVWAACREPLTKNGLSIIQSGSIENGVQHLTTLLCHASGEWISSEMILKPMKDDLQALGSALSYLRRYSLSAIVGVVAEDDDAESTFHREDAKKTAPKECLADLEPVGSDYLIDLGPKNSLTGKSLEEAHALYHPKSGLNELEQCVYYWETHPSEPGSKPDKFLKAAQTFLAGKKKK